jgi:hypothetical protein
MPINTLPGRFELLFELPHTESRMESWNGILQNKTKQNMNVQAKQPNFGS